MISLHFFEKECHFLHLPLHIILIILQCCVFVQLHINADILLLLSIRNSLKGQIFLSRLLGVPLDIDQISPA